MSLQKIMYASVAVAAICVSIAACSNTTKADDNDTAPYNGMDLVAPLHNHFFQRVDDGKNSCYVLYDRTTGRETMSCVVTDTDGGTDQIGKTGSAPPSSSDDSDDSSAH